MTTRVTLAACFVLLLASLLAACSTKSPTEEPLDPTGLDDASPYVREVLSDEPVAYWRLEGDGDRHVEGAIEGDPNGATRFDEEHSIVLGGMNEFDKYAFTVSMWVKAPKGRFLAYTSEEQPAGLVLEHGESLGVTILGERVETEVKLDEQWHLLSVSWDGEDGRTVVAVDGMEAWRGEVAAGGMVPKSGQLVLGKGDAVVDEVVWHDSALHHSRMLSHVGVARGRLEARSVSRGPDARVLPAPGHRYGVTSVASSPDGRMLASVTGDKTIKLWDLEGGREIRKMSGHSDHVLSVAFSPHGRTLVSSGADSTIKLWDVESGTEIETLSGHDGPVNSITFSPDGRTLASGSTDSTVKVWDVESGKELQTLSGHSYVVTSIAFSPNGRMLASGSRDFPSSNVNDPPPKAGSAKVKLWDVESGRELTTLQSYSGTAAITDIKFSPDGRTLASGSWGGWINLWDVESGKELKISPGTGIYEFGGHYVTSIAYSPDGRAVASGSNDKAIRIWDVRSGREIQTMTGHSDSVSSVAYSPDGRTLASGSNDKTIRLWDVESGRKIRALGGHGVGVMSVALQPDGQALAVGRMDGTIKLWDLASGKAFRTLSGHSDSVESIAFSPNGRMLVSASEDGSIKLWDIASGREIQTLADGGVSFYPSVAFGPDGHTVAWGMAGGGIKLWDIASGKRQKILRDTLCGWVNAIQFSPDGRTLASSCRMEEHSPLMEGDEVITLWNVESGKKLKTLSGHSYDVTSIAFDPNGGTLASSSVVGTIKLWDVATGKKLKTLGGHSDDVLGRQLVAACRRGGACPGSQVAFSPDGRTLASDHAGAQVKLWDVERGEALETLSGHRTSVTSIAFRPDGESLVSSSEDGTIKWWNLDDGTHLSLVSDGEEWLIYTDDGYFDASPNGAGLVHAVQGLRTFGIDQLALKNNRPDIILKRMGTGTPELIEHYKEEWRRRVAKAGLTEGDLAAEADLPGARILRARKLDEKPGHAELIFEFRDTRGLKNYQIYVDNVPLFEGYGKPVDGEKKRVQIRHEVPLTDGTNKIEVSALSTRGQESMRASRFLQYEEPNTSDLYFVGFGVSDYESDKITDLEYADDDVEDLAALLEGSREAFGKVHTKTFVDKDVTVATIEAAKDFLDGSKPRDTVVLFVAGHGMYDRSDPPVYYYLTHGAKLDDLASTAADFDLIESLLDGIPARNKLFLMDTCQSGESTEAVAVSAAGEGERVLKARAMPRGFIAASTEQSAPREYLLERDRFIYRDLRRRTGAIVISSSLGSEYSYEHDDYQNGAFTEAIAQALTTPEADADQDGQVSTDELRDYVRKEVPKLTNDRQHPTVDRDNIHRKFALPVTCASAAYCIELAHDARYGRGGKRDMAKAAELYEKACQMGEEGLRACAQLGYMMQKSLGGLTKDNRRSLELYTKSCTDVEAWGCAGLAGLPQNKVKAVSLYRRACEHGSPRGCEGLGLRYYSGAGVSRDYARAAELFEKACDAGKFGACFNLGVMHIQGDGFTQDFKRAAEIFEDLCDEGFAAGCSTLGHLYYLGKGVDEDKARAAELYKKACDDGDEFGCDQLRNLHE
ncbi:MAG: caspase family protein [Myxococcota bacterium]